MLRMLVQIFNTGSISRHFGSAGKIHIAFMGFLGVPGAVGIDRAPARFRGRPPGRGGSTSGIVAATGIPDFLCFTPHDGFFFVVDDISGHGRAGSYLPPRHVEEDLHRRQTRSPAPALSNGDRHFRHSRVFGFTSAASASELSFAVEAAVLSVIINPPVAAMPL